ncbi:cyclic nucleotide-binding domain-containing protein [Mobilitalea sibirica]|uniref:Cyclic nucleotide-binding domain-containing protein n=1 Tax=Mobilitalea sibirica TaxID=1462919 RepID=A0A8J7HDC9_9FIRM|nr:cyclic nucleotide-binding domain-containing protein [Mobilitalea sibirica]MBH1941902.1 cyclic nucleotide-binding domain-containing protein [Mobilitalea sibirica]
MEWKINPNTVNQLAKGTVIFKEGDPVLSIVLLIKGRVILHNNGAKILLNSGTFLGLNDLYFGTYQSTYTAQDDSIVFVFTLNRVEDLESIISSNKEYNGFMVASLNKIIFELDQIYQDVIKHRTNLCRFITDNYSDYRKYAKKLGYEARTSEMIEALSETEYDIELIRNRIEYYKECHRLPMEVIKSFYSHGNSITIYQIEEQVDVINQLIGVLKELSKELAIMADCLVNDSNTCIYQLIAFLAIEVSHAGGDNSDIVDTMDNVIEEINKVEKLYDRKLGYKLSVNRKGMEEAYHILLTDKKGQNNSRYEDKNEAEDTSSKILSEMENSFQKIIGFAEISQDRAKEMEANIREFINLKDRMATDDNTRLIRKQLTDNYYELYLAVFLKAYSANEIPKIVDLFLKYGYADERLLTKEQLLNLYNLEDTRVDTSYNIYNIKDWLTLIYEGKKEPSKNEFDLEYPDMLLTLKKQGKLTERDVREWSEDRLRKLEYEIQNMFRYNNRTTNGQISTFVPILYKDTITNDLEKILVTGVKVINAMNELLNIDYSIFDREVLYSSKENNIVKEYIIKTVYPDIILMPVVGMNGVMWQDITGRKRDSCGRFLLPSFCEYGLTAILTRIFGRFRWEMCRTIEGTAWNDIKHKSLTSEYSDYLQFYRKNKELSEEKKEKIKLQIQKGRNSSREVFVLDYEQWIKYESRGAIKLNKPVREIMATYCPFSKEIRDKLIHQPMFEEAMARFIKDRQKKIRDIEARHRMLNKDQIELTKELIDTLNYYLDR